MTARGQRTVRRLVSVSLLALVGGCTAPVQLARGDLASHRAVVPASESGAPRVRIGKIEDGRADPSLGEITGRSVSSSEIPAWIDDELAALASPGFVVVPGPAADLAVRPRLLKAYVDGVSVTKTAVIVLGVDIVAPGGTVTKHMYRGQHASMNWSSSAGEVVEALKGAAASCLEQLRVDLELQLHPDRPPAPAAPVDPPNI